MVSYRKVFFIYTPSLPKMKQLSVRLADLASALESLISWITEIGLVYPIVLRELNSPSVTNPIKYVRKK